MDCVNVAAQLIQNTVILSAAVELGSRWRELAEKMAKLSSAQIASYEAPHRGKNGEVNPQVRENIENNANHISRKSLSDPYKANIDTYTPFIKLEPIIK